MNKTLSTWICCQLGARENYAIPRALHRQGKLKCLITDAWISVNSPLNLLPQFFLTNLRQRYHPELQSAPITAFNHSLINWEVSQSNRKIKDWDKIIARNHWWQGKVLKVLKRYHGSENDLILFSYSYTALELFKYAKSRGWKTVLGQIDPGIVEEKLVFRESKKFTLDKPNLELAPLQYWTDWRKECTLADEIIVNSLWSSQALLKTGIPNHKIKVIPLAYQAPVKAKDFSRTYPDNFSHQRPLKVLFLGQIIVRKGIDAILKVIELFANQPIEFWFVGQVKINIPRSLKKHPQIKWLGKVSRSQANHYYQQADVFLFPTLSDGFGITQLEAQAWKLPLITSQYCGAVVKDGINGLILPNISGIAIAQALKFCLDYPHELAKFSQASYQVLSSFNLSQLAEKLQLLDTTKGNSKPLIHY